MADILDESGENILDELGDSLEDEVISTINWGPFLSTELTTDNYSIVITQ